MSILQDDDNYTIIQFSNKAGKEWTLSLAHKDADESSQHKVQIGEKIIEWIGVYQLSNK